MVVPVLVAERRLGAVVLRDAALEGREAGERLGSAAVVVRHSFLLHGEPLAAAPAGSLVAWRSATSEKTIERGVLFRMSRLHAVTSL
ncbi:hypothetical protein GCM10009717_36540 [Agromyces allii]|uniref:Uncharacterized protein n=1 Tax=Agromyces allii TaxID=393607 RepID=A0ABP5CR31_9MICO